MTVRARMQVELCSQTWAGWWRRGCEVLSLEGAKLASEIRKSCISDSAPRVFVLAPHAACCNRQICLLCRGCMLLVVMREGWPDINMDYRVR